MKSSYEINVIVLNDDNKVFEGVLYDWLENNANGDFSSLMEVIELCVPLMTGQKKEVETIEFHTGKWNIKVID